MDCRRKLKDMWLFTLLLLVFIHTVHSQSGTESVNQVQLIGGQAPHEGNLQVDVNGVWGYVCDDHFGFDEADVVCKDFGYEGAETFTRNNHFGDNSLAWRRSTVKFWLSSVNCSSAATFADCTSAVLGHHQCGPTEIAGLSCRVPDSRCEAELFPCRTTSECLPRDLVCNDVNDCDDGSDEAEALCQDVGVTRLSSNLVTANIPGAVRGVVYVKYGGEWGTVCDDDFTDEDAKVICRSLGYEGGWALGYSRTYLGIGNEESKVWVESLGCEGNEEWIGQCPFVNFGNNSCLHIEDSSVFCYDKDIEVRLSGGSQDVGSVELRLGDQWGSVCGTRFDDFDAQVVCRMLGYHGDDSQAYRQVGGVTTGTVWQMQMDCLGHEDDLQQCRLRFSNETCSNAAGVFCSSTSGGLNAGLQSFLPSQCGDVKDASTQFITRLARLRFGARPTRFDSPWLVSLRRQNTRPSLERRLLCGGTIISEYFVVTAAHCLKLLGALNLVVRVGDYDSDVVGGDEEEYFIDKVWQHEEFEKLSFNDNDIALLKIEPKNGRGIRFGPRVMPLCLPRVGESYEDLEDCTIIGWGRTSLVGEESNRPFEGEVSIRPDRECEESYVKGTNNYTSSFVCAGTALGEVSSCIGDSGGPLACRRPGETRKSLYGIVSYGTSCQPFLAPDALTRVTKYLRWIYNKISRSSI